MSASKRKEPSPADRPAGLPKKVFAVPKCDHPRNDKIISILEKIHFEPVKLYMPPNPKNKHARAENSRIMTQSDLAHLVKHLNIDKESKKREAKKFEFEE